MGSELNPTPGGSNSIRNLLPQLTKTSPWNSYVEDALERKLHRLVWVGQIDLKTAQREIAYKAGAPSAPLPEAQTSLETAGAR